MSNKIVTHGDKFHTDDVFAVATLFLVFGKENCEVIRTRDESIIATADYVIDVGGVYDPETNHFDHHQKGGAEDRPNGIPYAAFGLVWKKFGERLCGSKEVADIVEGKLIQQIDAGDNGKETYAALVDNVYPFTVNAIVDSYRPTWKEAEKWDERFDECLNWSVSVLERQIKIAQDWVEAKTIIVGMYEKTEDKRIIIIDDDYKNFGRELLVGILNLFPEPLYAVYFRNDSSEWHIVAMREEYGSFKPRKAFPEDWAAKRGEELEAATGVPGSVFCHKGRWMCRAHTKEGALALANKALNA